MMLGLVNAAAMCGNHTNVYLFPGQGADYRQFNRLELPDGYDTVHVRYPVPAEHETLAEYALRFIPLIDQEKPFILLGVSLGGMISVELADTLDPELVVLVSSAKSFNELPGRYRFLKKVPINRLVPKGLTKAGARLLQGIVEPDRREDPELFRSMISSKDAVYLKRTVDMIINWQRQECPSEVFHIHGDADHTLPVDHVDPDMVVRGGSHLMIYTRAPEINRILTWILAPPPLLVPVSCRLFSRPQASWPQAF